MKRNLAVLTSGGDAPGMNAAVRAVVRAAHYRGVGMHAIYEGYQGMVDGGDKIRALGWEDVGGILHQGGTVIGSARCPEFREREGRLRAARHLIQHGIDGLVVIGGDGSLTGANLFREEWPSLVSELSQNKLIGEGTKRAHPHLQIVGLVGSIDNDMFGTDMTIGADTALHRIVDAVDSIASTAASHHRTFVVEVMGRNCGYLALMSGLATGANYVLIPERPPVGEWEAEMCGLLQASKDVGRRHGMVIVAEGAKDQEQQPITAQRIKEVLEDRLGSDTRITILGHVQRGGAPSAFDRYLATILGHQAVETLLSSDPRDPPKLLGIQHNRVAVQVLMDCVNQTKQLAETIASQDYDRAIELRGGSFKEALDHLNTMQRAYPRGPEPGRRSLRVLILHEGGPAPGMNTAVRAAVRLGIEQGHTILGAQHGFHGLVRGDFLEMDWMSVHGWVSKGGAELGTSRGVPEELDVVNDVAERFEQLQIDGVFMIGGWSGYLSAYQLYQNRMEYRAFNIPIVCMPASINNSLPGSEHSIGADTALNSIIQNVDRIKQSAVASQRCFIVEVMGNDCGYLALMSGLATGAERVYLPEEGISLEALQEDVQRLVREFRSGKRLGLIIRSERADSSYTTDFIARLFQKEGLGLFDVRQSILGHVQQGGNPTPYDRIQATRLAAHGIKMVSTEAENAEPAAGAIGLQGGKVVFTSLADMPGLVEPGFERPKNQPWLAIRSIAAIMARSPGAL